jgi:hypothetical protein
MGNTKNTNTQSTQTTQNTQSNSNAQTTQSAQSTQNTQSNSNAQTTQSAQSTQTTQSAQSTQTTQNEQSYIFAIKQNKVRTVVNGICWFIVSCIFIAMYTMLWVMFDQIPKDQLAYAITFSTIVNLGLGLFFFIPVIGNFSNLRHSNAIWSDEDGIYFYTNNTKVGLVKWDDIENIEYDKSLIPDRDGFSRNLIVTLTIEQTSTRNFGLLMRLGSSGFKRRYGNSGFKASLALCKGRRKDNAQIVIAALNAHRSGKWC